MIVSTKFCGQPLILDLEEHEDRLDVSNFSSRGSAMIGVKQIRGHVVHWGGGFAPATIEIKTDKFTGQLQVFENGKVRSIGFYEWHPGPTRPTQEQIARDAVTLGIMYQEAMNGDKAAMMALKDWLEDKGIR